MNKHATPFGEIHLVAIDLDGTLLQPDMRLSDRAGNAILRIQKTGVEVVIASGRPYCSLPETVTQLPGLSYAITSNGAAIHCLPDGARIWGSCLSQAAVEVILAETAHFPVLLEAYISGLPIRKHGILRTRFVGEIPIRRIFGIRASRLRICVLSYSSIAGSWTELRLCVWIRQ